MTDLVDKTAVDVRWGSRQVNDNEAVLWRAGHTSVWIQRLAEDWMVAAETEPQNDLHSYFQSVSSLPLGVAWKRWAAMEEASSGTVRFNPAFPDRPLVVKTRSAVMVPPEKSIDLFINIPVWVEVSLETGHEPIPLSVFSTRTLSNTWFGNQFEGELCYALKGLATRHKDDLSTESLAAACRFSIFNHSSEPLSVDRLRVLPRHLGIYKSRHRLWTSVVRVVAHGPDRPSDLEYPERAPEEAGGSVRIRVPEEAYKPRNFRESLARYTQALFQT